jgi:hypothetical protein
VHRVKELYLAKGDIVFPARDALVRQTRQLNAPAESRPLPAPIDPVAGGGNAPAAELGEPVEATDTAEIIIFPRDDLPPPAFTPEGAEIEVDSPPAVTPLATEFKGLSYKFSDCGNTRLSVTAISCGNRARTASRACSQSSGSI